MTIEQAYQTLEIPIYSDIETIKEAYHRLSKAFHPDVHEGNGEKQTQLNEAYGVAMDFQKAGAFIVATSGVQNSIITLTRSVEISTYREEANMVIRRAIRISDNRLRPMAHTLWLITAVAGLIGFFFKEFVPLMQLSATSVQSAKIMAVVCGLMALATQYLKDSKKNQLEALADEYQDKQSVAIDLARLLNFQKQTTFDATVYTNPYRRNTGSPITEPAKMFNEISGTNRITRNRILLIKAKEYNLITPDTSVPIRPGQLNQFILNFDPSEFRTDQDDE